MATLERLPVATPHRPGASLTPGRVLVYVVLTLGGIVTLLPFVWAILSSFKSSAEIIRVPPTFWPETWTLASYVTIFTDPEVPLGRFFLNSLFVAVAHVATTLFTSSLAGYIFAKFRFWGQRTFFGFILAQLMIPFQIVMIPSYLILARMHLVDSLWGLIVPSMVDAFGIFLMRQSIAAIPSELIDAARINGASEFRIFWNIILPQLGAPLSALGIFNFMASWNDYLWPLIVITTHDRRTLPLLLTWYNTQHTTRHDLTMTASVIVLLPILLVYIVLQRRFVASLAMTGFK